MKRLFLPLALALTAAGCVGPDFTPPTAPGIATYTADPLPETTAAADVWGGQMQRIAAERDIPGQWWSLFHSPAINALIERALVANADLKASRAALRVADENALAQAGGWWPTLAGGFGAARQKTLASAGTNSAAGGHNSVYNLYTAQVGISYAPDIWGGISRQVESADAQAEAARFQMEAAALTLTTNVALAAIQEASLRGQIEATGEIVALGEQSLDILRKRFALGQVARADVLAQEAAVAQQRQSLPGLHRQLVQQRNLLAVLCGTPPSEPPAETFELSAIDLPEELPVSLPSRLVEQRPDIRAAAANLHAATAQVGIAIANRLPLINITAGQGSSAAFTDGKLGLFTPGTGFWALSGNLTQTLFDGFSLMHRQRAAEAGLDLAAAQYRSVVLGAFQNVADVLTALQRDAETLAAAVEAEHAAAGNLTITRRQLELGAVGTLTLLNAQQAELQARLSVVQAQAARFADSVALFQALGGGWWNRPKLADAEQP